MILQIEPIDHEQEARRHLNLLGIFKESIKLIVTWPNIFLQIILFAILPQYCINLFMSWKFPFSIEVSVNTSNDFSNTHSNISTSQHKQASLDSIFFKEYATYLLIKAICWIISFILHSILISSIVYAVASIYKNEKISFKQVITALPKAWKPYLVTTLCWFCAMLLCVFGVLLLWGVIFIVVKGKLGKQLIKFEDYFVDVGLIYPSIIWQLSIAISLIEKIYGFKALKKSRALIKGKMGTASTICIVMNLLDSSIVRSQIMQLVGVGVGKTIWYEILKMLWSILIELLGVIMLVMQAILYFVCKSYHHDYIEKSSIVDQLDEYIQEYVPIKEEFVKIDHLE